MSIHVEGIRGPARGVVARRRPAERHCGRRAAGGLGAAGLPLGRKRRRQRFALGATTAITTAAVASSQLLGSMAHALPQGGTVVEGDATIAYGTDSVVITQGSTNVIIEWDTFDVAANESVHFDQSALMAALNRVLSGEPSVILGSLSGAGSITLVNQAGIAFGASANVDVGAITATTIDILNSNFMANNLTFDQYDPDFADASVTNEGSITVSDQGLAALVAPGVANNGVIQARTGAVLLASGTSYTVDFYGDGLVNLAITGATEEAPVDAHGNPLDALVSNSGEIYADGGTVILAAEAVSGIVDNAINMDGVVQARAIQGRDGQIALVGGEGAGDVQVAGTLDASGADAGVSGGTVHVLGDTVALNPGADVNVSSPAGGGSALIGGAALGGGGTPGAAIQYVQSESVTAIVADAGIAAGGYVPTSDITYVDSAAQARASATEAGDGGRVSLWGGTRLEFYGAVAAAGAGGGAGGTIELGGDVVHAGGTASASGAAGGTITISARNLLSYGHLFARGFDGAGGAIGIDVSGRYLETAAAEYAADGATDGGLIAIAGGAEIYASGRHDVSGAAGAGGTIAITGAAIALHGAALDATGAAGGGSVFVGDADGDGDGALAASVVLGAGTAIHADAAHAGDGGTIALWSADSTVSAATLTARGGPAAGDGGFIEVSSVETIRLGGRVDAGAANGAGGTLLLDPRTLTVDDAAAAGGGPAGLTRLVDPNEGVGSNEFGASLASLPNGNVVVADPGDDFAASDAGAVYLFDESGTLLSTLTGTTAGDGVGSDGITVLTNGNYVVTSELWNNGLATSAGAVTWVDGTIGLSGAVSAANSLVGTSAFDQVGSGGITALSNGDYIVTSQVWRNGAVGSAGAVTLGNGTAGVSGAVSATNSLVGTSAFDRVGAGGITVLSNGNYLVLSPTWDNAGTGGINAGAATFGSGTAGVVGAVSAANSLVGTSTGDQVGSGGIAVLSNGNYLVVTPEWNTGGVSDAGAVTFGDGTIGVSGVVSSANSLVGSTLADRVGSSITVLSNGNYLVVTPEWNSGGVSDVGAVTFGDGTTGVSGVVSSANSLVGTSAIDQVGLGGVTGLSNGNYVVLSPTWDNAGTGGINAGAATFGSGTTGVVGAVSAANSLVGTSTGDQVGSGGITELANGNYVVRSNLWNNGGGAATWGSGTIGVSGAVSAANSLVDIPGALVGSGGIVALSNGNYVVVSPLWDSLTNPDAGAVTFGDGTVGVSGTISNLNSLVGGSPGDRVGSGGVTALSNGNYVVSSPEWGNGGGAVTWCSGTVGVSGVVTAANSLVEIPGARIGSGGIVALSNGNYVIVSPLWDSLTRPDAGAVTWGDGTVPITGSISNLNSLVGGSTGDQIGSGGLTALRNGNYVVASPLWDNGGVAQAGAVTWGSGTVGVSGVVTAANSLVGTSANDSVGGFGVLALSNGNYLVRSFDWNNGSVTQAGAVTFGDGTTGVSGAVSAANSLVGTSTGDRIGSSGILELGNGSYVVSSLFWDNGIVVDAGAVTWGDGTTGVMGAVSAANSLVGSSRDDQVGSGGILHLGNGDFLVRTLFFDTTGNGLAGALTFISGTTGRTLDGLGTITTANSLIGRVALPTSVIVPDDANERFVAGLVGELSDVGIFTGGAGGLGTPGAATFANMPGEDVSVTSSFITDVLDTGTSVVMQANTDVIVDSAIVADNPNGAGGSLTFQAGRSILVNANIVTDDGDLTLSANDPGALAAFRAAGAADIVLGAGVTIDAGDGGVFLTIHDSPDAATIGRVQADPTANVLASLLAIDSAGDIGTAAAPFTFTPTGSELDVSAGGDAFFHIAGAMETTIAGVVGGSLTLTSDPASIIVDSVGAVTGLDVGGNASITVAGGAGRLAVLQALSSGGTTVLDADEVNLDADIAAAGGLTGTATLIDVFGDDAEIQDAVDVASDAGVAAADVAINVADGLYALDADGVVVDKTLSLFGAPGEPDMPTIDGGGGAVIGFDVTGDDVVVSGFRIEDFDVGIRAEIDLVAPVAGTSVDINSNSITDARNGAIRVSGYEQAAIRSNEIAGALAFGVSLADFDSAVVSNNAIDTGGYGILFDAPVSGDLDITGNLVTAGLDGIRFAGAVDDADVLIDDNDVVGDDDGVAFAAAVQNGSAVTISNNVRIHGVREDGVRFAGAISGATTTIGITGNTLVRGADRGIAFDDGATITDASVTIAGNTEIRSDNIDAILFNGTQTGATVLIGGATDADGNDLIIGDGDGLDVAAIVGGSFTVAHNAHIEGDGGDGIEFEAAISGGAVIEVSDNVDIIGGTQNGINFQSSVTDSTVLISGNNDIVADDHGILFGSALSGVDLDITDNDIEAVDLDGIRFAGALDDARVLIDDNDVLGRGGGVLFAGAVRNGSRVTISNNEALRGLNEDAVAFLGAVTGATTTIGIGGNTLIDGERNGIAFQGAITDAAVTIAGNTEIRSVGSDAILFDGTLTRAAVLIGGAGAADGNGLISGGAEGIDVDAIVGGAFTVAHNGRIEGERGDGIVFADAIFDGAVVAVSGNGAIVGTPEIGIHFQAAVTDAAVTIAGNAEIRGRNGILFDGALTGATVVIGGATDADGNGLISGDEDGVDVAAISGGAFTVAHNGRIEGANADAIVFDDTIDAGVVIEVRDNTDIVADRNGIDFTSTVTDATLLISGNTGIDGDDHGILFSQPLTDVDLDITGNVIAGRLAGISFDRLEGDTDVTASGNAIEADGDGVLVSAGGIVDSARLSLGAGNAIDAGGIAVNVRNVASSLTISGGSYTGFAGALRVETRGSGSAGFGRVVIADAPTFTATDPTATVAAFLTRAGNQGVIVDLTGSTAAFVGGDVGLSLDGPGIDLAGTFSLSRPGGGVFDYAGTLGASTFRDNATFFVRLGDDAEFAPGEPNLLYAGGATFIDTGSGLNVLGADLVDADGSFADLAGFLAVEDRLFHYPDADGRGLIWFGQDTVLAQESLQAAVNLAGFLGLSAVDAVAGGGAFAGVYGGSIEVWVDDLTINANGAVIDVALVDPFANNGDVDNGFYVADLGAVGDGSADALLSNADLSNGQAVDGVTINAFTFINGGGNIAVDGADVFAVEIGGATDFGDAAPDAATNTTIDGTGTTITGVSSGIVAYTIGGTTTLSHNDITATGAGILFASALTGGTVDITGNDIESTLDAVRFAAAIDGSTVRIADNNAGFVSTAGHGIFFGGFISGADIDIVGTVVDAGRDGIHFDEALDDAQVLIEGNDVVGGDDGIHFDGIVDGADIAVVGNLVAGRDGDGIDFDAAVRGGATVRIGGNSAILGGDNGIELAGVVDGARLDIEGNGIIVGGGNGIHLRRAEIELDRLGGHHGFDDGGYAIDGAQVLIADNGTIAGLHRDGIRVDGVRGGGVSARPAFLDDDEESETFGEIVPLQTEPEQPNLLIARNATIAGMRDGIHVGTGGDGHYGQSVSGGLVVIDLNGFADYASDPDGDGPAEVGHPYDPEIPVILGELDFANGFGPLDGLEGRVVGLYGDGIDFAGAARHGSVVQLSRNMITGSGDNGIELAGIDDPVLPAPEEIDGDFGPTSIFVHNNFIHDNGQRLAGEGPGEETSSETTLAGSGGIHTLTGAGILFERGIGDNAAGEVFQNYITSNGGPGVQIGFDPESGEPTQAQVDLVVSAANLNVIHNSLPGAIDRFPDAGDPLSGQPNGSFAIANYADTGIVNAPENWWGSAVAGEVAGAIAGPVSFLPYLATGVDSNEERLPGFTGLGPFAFQPGPVFVPPAETDSLAFLAQALLLSIAGQTNPDGAPGDQLAGRTDRDAANVYDSVFADSYDYLVGDLANLVPASRGAGCSLTGIPGGVRLICIGGGLAGLAPAGGGRTGTGTPPTGGIDPGLSLQELLNMWLFSFGDPADTVVEAPAPADQQANLGPAAATRLAASR